MYDLSELDLVESLSIFLFPYHSRGLPGPSSVGTYEVQRRVANMRACTLLSPGNNNASVIPGKLG